VKKLVYDDQSVSMQRLCGALKNNFEGYEDVHKACVGAPKYGNDIDDVDMFANDIMDWAARELETYDTLYAKMSIGTLSVSTNTPQGLVVSALPSGRKATVPLADGISPAQGTDRMGPTAIIKSVDKINHEALTLGILHNMKLEPALLADDRGVANFVALLRTHNQLGGGQIQFNCVAKEKLLDAQRNPDQYKSLMIRVAGYSAYFVELCKEIQDEIISRTPQSRWA
jgi:pyruvate-formate lyase